MPYKNRINVSATLTTSMCQEMTQGTICNNSRGYFLCECPLFKYFNRESNLCKDQLTINTKCNFTNQCQSIYGLASQNGICK